MSKDFMIFETWSHILFWRVWPAKCLQLRTEDTSVNSVVMLPATLTKLRLHPLRTPRQQLLCAIAAVTLQRHRRQLNETQTLHWLRGLNSRLPFVEAD